MNKKRGKRGKYKKKDVILSEGGDCTMNSRQLILMYDSIIHNLDMDSDKYLIAFDAITRRRDELINKKSMYSKKIKLTTNWYKPSL